MAAGEASNRFRDDGAEAGVATTETYEALGPPASSSSSPCGSWPASTLQMTVFVFVPLVVVIVAASGAPATGWRATVGPAGKPRATVTGLLGELFGAVQAVQVAGAEARVVDHFRRLSAGAAGGPCCAMPSPPASWKPSPPTPSAWAPA